MEEIKELLNNKAEIIEKTLQEIMEIKSPVSETLLESMKYSLFSGGKRIRPILTVMVTEMLNGDIDIARKVGASLELIHTYSLVHDDLPGMDDDDYRRGNLSNHKVYGSGIAILAGDALLTYAFNIISQLNFSPQKLLKIINLISCEAGINGMVGGQVLDLEGEQKNLNIQELNKIHKNKTGGLFRASIMAGVYCGEPTSGEIEALKEFSKHLGLLFQIVDDILDITGDEEKLGKKTGKDEELNKSTYPGIIGLEMSKEKAEKIALKAKRSLRQFGERADQLKKLVDFVLKRQY